MRHPRAGRPGAGRARTGALAWFGLILAGCSHSAAHITTQRGANPCATRTAYARPDPDRPRYRMTLAVGATSPVVRGAEQVRFTPDLATSRLVFRLWPNGPIERKAGASLAVLGAVTSGGKPLRSSMPDPTTLVVTPPQPLAAGSSITVSLHWRLRVPLDPPVDRLARRGPELGLASFFPILAWQPGVGWATDPPTPILAETSTSPSADFDVSMPVPAGEQAVATGRELAPGRWQGVDVRDFAVAVDRFREATAVARAPGRVLVTAATGPGVSVPPALIARRVAGYLEQYNRRFGPYPWPTLDVPVTADLTTTGIEYPNLIFEGAAGALQTVSHEVGHQWFYSLVGNDQARDPWLDEGLATYVQVTADHLQGAFARFGIPPAAAGHLGAPMSYWDRLPYVDYQAGVYLQGERALAGLGPQARVDCALRGYVAANAYRIATQPDLVRALARVFPGAPASLRRLGAHVAE